MNMFKGKLNMGLKGKITVWVCTILVLAIGINMVFVGEQIKGVIYDSYGKSALVVAQMAGKSIDGDKFEDLADKMSPNNPYFKNLLRDLQGLQTAANAAYVYTMQQVEGNNFVYVVDSTDTEAGEYMGWEQDISAYDPNIIDAMLNGTECYSALEYDEEYGYLISATVPIRNSDGELVGLVGCDVVPSGVEEMLRIKGMSMIALNLIILAISVIGLLFVLRHLLKHLKTVLGEISRIANFELAVPVAVCRTKDELQGISEGVEVLREAIQSMFETIQTQTMTLDEELNEESQSVDTINNSVTELSQHVEKITATLEETAASTEEIQTSINYIADTATVIANKSNTGATRANEINERAQQTSELITESKERTALAIQEKEKALNQSIEGVAAVKEIEQLTKVIMGIAEQTNLLALNAAIEAARAGENGKGFAVVADEVRQLAEASKKTVSEIQGISNEVIGVVDSLVRNATDILELVERDINEDYDHMLRFTDNYKADAQSITQLTDDFKQTAETLKTAIDAIVINLTEINNASTQGAEGSVVITEQVVAIDAQTQMLITQMKEINKGKEELKHSIERFQ